VLRDSKEEGYGQGPGGWSVIGSNRRGPDPNRPMYYGTTVHGSVRVRTSEYRLVPFKKNLGRFMTYRFCTGEGFTSYPSCQYSGQVLKWSLGNDATVIDDEGQLYVGGAGT